MKFRIVGIDSVQVKPHPLAVWGVVFKGTGLNGDVTTMGWTLEVGEKELMELVEVFGPISIFNSPFGPGIEVRFSNEAAERLGYRKSKSKTRKAHTTPH